MKKVGWKKVVCLLAVFALLVTPLGGCSSPAAEADNEDPGSGGSEEKIKLEFWHGMTAGDALFIIEDAVARFMDDHPEYDVEAVGIQSDSYKQRLQIAMGTDSLPDVFFHWTGGPMIEYINAGKIQDITDLMNQDGYVDRFLDGGIAQATHDGKIWAVPGESTTVAGLFYNKDIFERLDIEVPATIDDLESAADTLLANGITPFALANQAKWPGSMWYMYLATRYGGVEPFANAANRAGGSFEDPAFVYAGEKITEWVEKGYFNQGVNGLDEGAGQARNLFYNEDTAMYLMGSWFLSIAGGGENPEFLDKVGMMPFPQATEGTGDPNIVVGTIGDNFYSISANTVDRDGAFKLIQYLTDDVANQMRVERSRNNPPVKGMVYTDPMNILVQELVEGAPAVQLWYDQYLPPELAQVHLDTTQQLFGLNMDPETAARTVEEAAGNILQ